MHRAPPRSQVLREQQVAVVVEVADEGAVQPASSMRCLISATRAAAAGRLTVTRTISDPASASSTHCAAVPRASAVSVNVIDWTTIGAPRRPARRGAPTARRRSVKPDFVHALFTLRLNFS
jgi:hypothetical protein